MQTPRISPPNPLRLLVTVGIIGVATVLRIWPLHSLGTSLVWLTFYPAVMIASVYGGFWSGLLAITLAFSIATVGWQLIASGPFIVTNSDWLGLAVFVVTGTTIAGISEAMLLARRRAEEALRQAEIANQAKSVFLANMSHELRTPLNSVLGYAQLMQRDGTLPATHHKYLDAITRSGEHLMALINDILDLTKVEAKRITLSPTTFDLHALIGDLREMFRLKTESKGLYFSIQGLDELPRHIVADKTKLRTILINILGNAVKFTGAGGITASFSLREENPGQTYLQAGIEDTGPGIAEYERDLLFHYFQQTESGRKSNSGTGLGLAISQEYAKMMGGEIRCTSREGVGSTFLLSVRVELASEIPSQSDACTRSVVGLAPGQRVPRILVADDSTENRQLLVELFTKVGLDVRQAVNGLEAIEISNQWHPDLIWMDIRMQAMDGIEATRLIKADPHGSQTKIIALSAHVFRGERDEIIAAGCDDFVGKPYHEHELFEVMGKHLGLHYQYEESVAGHRSGPLVGCPCLELGSLNAEVLEELRKAATNTDAERIEEIAGGLMAAAPEQANALQRCAENFDYQAIHTALQKTTGQIDDE